jgi:hypothetical protein
MGVAFRATPGRAADVILAPAARMSVLDDPLLPPLTVDSLVWHVEFPQSVFRLDDHRWNATE